MSRSANYAEADDLMDETPEPSAKVVDINGRRISLFNVGSTETLGTCSSRAPAARICRSPRVSEEG